MSRAARPMRAAGLLLAVLTLPGAARSGEEPAREPAPAPPCVFVPGGAQQHLRLPDGEGAVGHEAWARRAGGKWAALGGTVGGDARFLFPLAEEGVYEVCTVPAGSGEPPADARVRLLVTVDRTPPQGAARVEAPADGFLPPAGEVVLWWEFKDPNLGSAPVSLECRTGSAAEWKTLEDGLDAAGRASFPTLARMADAADDSVIDVRFLAHDRAGNAAAAAAGKVKTDRLAPQVRFTGPAAAVQNDVIVTFEAADRGPAGLGGLELWFTADEGRSWRRCAEQPAPTDRSLRIVLPGPGRYGLTLAARDAAGNRLPPPAAGNAPQFVLCTDRVPPRVRVANADEIEGRSFSPRDEMVLRWHIADENLAERPVKVEFSYDGGASWSAASEALADARSGEPAAEADDSCTGSCRWRPPPIDSDRCKLRVKAVDVMGNCAAAETGLFTVDSTAPGERLNPPAPRDLIERADVELRNGLRSAAADHAGLALARLDAKAEPGLTGKARLLRGRAVMSDNWPQALADLEKAMELLPDAPGLAEDLAAASYEVGRVKARAGDLPEAMKLLSRATSLYDRVLAATGGRAASHYNLAQALLCRSRLEHRPEDTVALAEREFLKSLEISRKSGERNLTANACAWLAGMKEEAKDFRAAAELWKEAADNYDDGSEQRKEALSRAALARHRR